MNVYLININKINKEMINEVKKKLPSRFEYANKYKQEKDVLRSFAASYLLCKIIDNIDDYRLKISSLGKPFLDGGPYFSISHSGDYAALAVDDSEIGLDIEFIDKKRNLKNIPYVSNEFYKDSSIEEMFLIWVKKESYVKLTGKGLSELSNVNLSNINKTFYNKADIYNNYVISVSSFKNIDKIEVKEL